MSEDETDDDFDALSGFPCDHEDYDVDILSGRAFCNFCSHHWYVSEKEILRQIEHEAAYHDMCEREERRQWWRDLVAPIMRPFHKLLWRFRQTRKRLATDDDIPF